MADHVDRKKRSLIMAAVHSKDTSPEMAVRKMVHGLGYRYRLHVRILPGRPDLVFPSRRKIIFVHGCFWHRPPKVSLREFAQDADESFGKRSSLANVARDRRVGRQLKRMGWAVLTVWQCELKKPERLTERLNDFLSN